MAAARTNAAQRNAKARFAARAVNVAEPARSWLLGALVMLLVARPLLPSEGVSWIGDGQPFNLLTILLAAAYLVLAMAERGFYRKWNLADAAVAVLVLLCMGSVIHGAQHGAPRPSVNMLFEWLSLGLVYFLARQLVRTPQETRALVAVMVSLAVVMCAYGFYQAFISLPATRAAYAADPDEALRAVGQWFPPDSAARQQFENRLQSTEPFATFALANSLAGFLAAWSMPALAMALGQLMRIARPCEPSSGANAPTSRAASWLSGVGLTIGLAAVLACLILTKSRSAYVAVAAGVVLYPWFDPEIRRRWLSQRLLLALIAAAVLLVLGAVAIRGLDVHVLTEATKSFGYRLEYWRSTLRMIAHSPWLGVGPGSFQDFYTQYKLPTASEEIRDPHNFLLEVWATAGTFALVAMGMVLVSLAWRTWNAAATVADERAPSETKSSGLPESPRNAVAILCGAAAGFLLAFVVAPPVRMVFSEQQMTGGLLVGVAVTALAWPWIRRGALPVRVPALAVLVLAIHLLAAGGIAYPAISDSFWLLVALGFNQYAPVHGATAATAPRHSLGRGWIAALLLLACGAAIGCYRWGYRPVVDGHMAMLRATEPARGADERLALLMAATIADPLTAEPWWAIAELEHARLLDDPTHEPRMKRFSEATSKVLELRPNSSAAWRQCGRWYYDLYARDPSLDAADPARVCFARAVEHYPTSAELRGEYALALGAAGDPQAARQQLAIARHLDEVTPHADKKLSPALREQLQRMESSFNGQ